VREYVIQRDKGRCRYCGELCQPRRAFDPRHPYDSRFDYYRDAYCIDHVLAHAKGGSDHPANLVTSCEDCNLRKYDSSWKPLPVPAE